MPSFLPTTDSGMLAFSLNFSTKISASPTTYGLTAPAAVALATLHANFSTAYTVANTPATRTKSAVAAKNTARETLKTSIRLLAKIVEGTATVTDAQKLDLGLNVRAQPTPIPAPAEIANIDIVERMGTAVTIKVHDGTGSRRARPAGVAGISLFSHVGPTAPVDVKDWFFEGNTSAGVTTVQFDSALPAGTVVWFTAFYYNPRGESGTGCAPVSAILAGGGMSMAA